MINTFVFVSQLKDPIENLKIVEPLSADKKVSYPANETVNFNASITKGTDVAYNWVVDNYSIVTNCSQGETNFTYSTSGTSGSRNIFFILKRVYSVTNRLIRNINTTTTESENF